MPAIPQIQIQQTYAKVGIKTSSAKLNIEQPKPEVNIHQEHIKVEIHSTPAKLQVDQSKAWKAFGIRSPFELREIITSETKRLVLDAIASIAEKGDRLAAIHQKQDPIPELARENTFKTLDINYLGEAVKDNVNVTFIPASLDINWHGGYADINIKARKPKIEYIPGRLEMYLRQKNDINISVSKVDQRI